MWHLCLLSHLLCVQVFIYLSTVCKASIAEKRSYIETIHKTIKNLEEEIGVNQSNVLRNKEEAKRYGVGEIKTIHCLITLLYFVS